jgi:hypothetical protein
MQLIITYHFKFLVTGPLVTISERVLSFGCTKAGYSVKRTVTLSNEANMDAAYQVILEFVNTRTN